MMPTPTLSAILDRLDGGLEWMVLFRLAPLRRLCDDATLRAMFFLPETIHPADHDVVVLTARGRLLAGPDGLLAVEEAGVPAPAPGAPSLADVHAARLALVDVEGADCLGLGCAEGHPPVLLHAVIEAGEAAATAVLADEPDGHAYELLPAAGLRYLGGEWRDGLFVARYRNRLPMHVLSGRLAGFARTHNCNLFFLRHCRLDADLEAGLASAAEKRIAHGRALAVAAVQKAALAARTTSQPMTCLPPPPDAPEPYGDLVPLGFLGRALKAAPADLLGLVNDRSPITAAAMLLDRHLDSRRQDGLWAFHGGRLVTSTDSALVLLGRQDRDAVAALDRFADGRGGYVPQLWTTAEAAQRPGFMPQTDENRHWCQADLGTTLLVRALRREAGLPAQTPLAMLEAEMPTRGGLYFANPFFLDWLTALAIADEPEAAPLRDRLAAEIQAAANPDLSFGRYDVAFSTACAALALAALGRRGRLLRGIQLRLLELADASGRWPAPCPFYSTFRSDGPPASAVTGRAGGHVRVGDEWHEVSLYEDTHRHIMTAVAALALLEDAGDTAAAPALPAPSARAAPHPRYACVDAADYIARFALPPYVARSALAARALPAEPLSRRVTAALGPVRLPQLLSDDAVTRATAVAAELPGTLSPFFGFEVRLNDPRPEADVLFCCEGAQDDGLATLAGLTGAALPDRPEWHRLSAFARACLDPEDPLAACVFNAWLEYDLAGVAPGDAAPVPSVFLGTDRLRGGMAPAPWLGRALATLRGAPLDPAAEAVAWRFMAALPPQARVFQVGLMLSRPVEVARLCARGLPPEAIAPVLTAAGWAGDAEALAAQVAAVAPLADRIDLDVDVTPEGLGPKIGLEVATVDPARLPPLLDHLVEVGLLLPAKRDGLLGWAGLSHQRLARGDWPADLGALADRAGPGHGGAFARWVHHVKLVHQHGALTEAKGYLGARFVVLADADLKRIVQNATSDAAA